MTENESPARGNRGRRQKELRDNGLCIVCGRKAAKSTARAHDVNKRLAEGRGLAAEYKLAVGPTWREDGPPPTLKRLSHEPRCETCAADVSRKIKKTAERRHEASDDPSQRPGREVYQDRIARGRCGRCGRRPPVPGTVECAQCRDSREARALKHPDAGTVVDLLKAGESQASIRLNRGFKRTLIEPLSLMLRRTGELPGGERRKTGEAGTDPPRTAPAYDDHRDELLRRWRSAQTDAEIADGLDVGTGLIRKWLGMAGLLTAERTRYRQQLRRALAKLESGQSAAEIAKAIGRTVPTVKRMLAQAGREDPEGTRTETAQPKTAPRGGGPAARRSPTPAPSGERRPRRAATRARTPGHARSASAATKPAGQAGTPVPDLYDRTIGEILRRYQRKQTMTAIAEAIGIDRGTVHSYLKRAGKLRADRKALEARIDEIMRLRREGRTQGEIAIATDLARSTVSDYLRDQRLRKSRKTADRPD